MREFWTSAHISVPENTSYLWRGLQKISPPWTAPNRCTFQLSVSFSLKRSRDPNFLRTSFRSYYGGLEPTESYKMVSRQPESCLPRKLQSAHFCTHLHNLKPWTSGIAWKIENRRWHYRCSREIHNFQLVTVLYCTHCSHSSVYENSSIDNCKYHFLNLTSCLFCSSLTLHRNSCCCHLIY